MAERPLKFAVGSGGSRISQRAENGMKMKRILTEKGARLPWIRHCSDNRFMTLHTKQARKIAFLCNLYLSRWIGMLRLSKCSDPYWSFINHVNACWHLVTIATVTTLYIIAHLASSSHSETRQFYVIVKDLGGMLYQEWNIRVRSTRMF